MAGGGAPRGLTFPRGHTAAPGGHLHFGLLTLPPLAQQLSLEGGHRAQQVPPLHLRRRDHDAAIQELADGAQKVLPVVGLVGSLVKQLGTGEQGLSRPRGPLGGGFREQASGRGCWDIQQHTRVRSSCPNSDSQPCWPASSHSPERCLLRGPSSPLGASRLFHDATTKGAMPGRAERLRPVGWRVF